MKRALGFFFLGQAVLLFIVWFNLALWAGEYIDSVCTLGRISDEQARAVNDLPFNKCPGYNDGVCEAKLKDRIVRRECSEFMRGLHLRDNETWKPIRNSFQQFIGWD